MNEITMQLGDLTKIATYEEFDRAFENESRRVSQGFIRMGYLLRRARDTDILYNSGYKSIAEYAEKKYGFKPDYVSNLIKVNEKYSEGGYSDRIQDRYGKWGFSLLVELADLPEVIAEEIPDGIKREEIREVKREVKAEERITPIEAALEEETGPTRVWDSILSKFVIQYYHSNAGAFPDAWVTMRKAAAGAITIEQAVMDVLAPSGIGTKIARIRGVGKYMLSIRDETTPPALVNIRSEERTTVGWGEVRNAMDEIFNNPLDSTYQDTWRELYGEPFAREKSDERSISERKGEGTVFEKNQPDMEKSETEEQPEPAPAVEDDQPRGVEEIQTDNAEDRGYAGGVVDDRPDGGEAGEQTADFETEEIAPAQSMSQPEGYQTTVEDYPEMLPEGYIPAEKQTTDEVTMLWDRARTLAEGIQGWMTEHSYGVGRGTKAGLDDIMNAASELQEVALELKHRL